MHAIWDEEGAIRCQAVLDQDEPMMQTMWRTETLLLHQREGKDLAERMGARWVQSLNRMMIAQPSYTGSLLIICKSSSPYVLGAMRM